MILLGGGPESSQPLDDFSGLQGSYHSSWILLASVVVLKHITYVRDVSTLENGNFKHCHKIINS